MEVDPNAHLASRILLLFACTSMDSLEDAQNVEAAPEMPLSYDEEVPYEKQVAEPSLADRISRNKLYLLADSTVARSGKVRKTPW